MLLCGTGSVRYQKDDLFIIGSGLPHVFVGEKDILTESISLYFNSDWLLNLYPESNYYPHFFKMANRGVKISDWTKKGNIEDILNKGGLYRVSAFVELIQSISESNSQKALIDKEQSITLEKYIDSEKLNEVFKHISENIDKIIKLEDLADITNLTPPSFCRFFKQKTGKTVSQYISELRVESACRLLKNQDLTVEEVGYMVGYNNFSNFLRQFKKVRKQTPKEYRTSSNGV